MRHMKRFVFRKKENLVISSLAAFPYYYTCLHRESTLGWAQTYFPLITSSMESMIQFH